MRARRKWRLRLDRKKWCPGGESNPHEEKSPEDFKSSASAIPPPGRVVGNRFTRFQCRVLVLILYLTQAAQTLRAAPRAASYRGTAEALLRISSQRSP